MSAAASAPHIHTPVLLYVDGSQRRRIPLRKLPFTIGRRVEKDLVLRETRCSRDHAQIVCEGDDYFLVDEGSKLGTYVNGTKVTRHRLNAKDVLEFAVRGGAYIVFDAPESEEEVGAFVSKVSGWALPSGSNEFATLNILLEAARKLNSSGVIDEVFHTLLDTSLRLTNAERGFVFLREGGEFRMVAGRNARGDVLSDDATISRSSLMEAVNSGCEFVVTEADDIDKLAGRMSVENFGLSSVICIPLRRLSLGSDTDPRPVQGMLYLDSHSLAGRLSGVSHDVLRTIATEAGTLVENATLVKAQQAARRTEQEIEIAAEIQRRLISPRFPEVPYAEVRGRSIPCHQIGGDFFEVVGAGESLTVVVADVAGKGISAALLASVLQGMVFSQLIKGEPLDEVARITHAFLCEREMGERYCTMVMARVHADGELEIMNCGHLPPVLVRASGETRNIEGGCPPVGLVPIADFGVVRERLQPGDRLVLITDGITETENCDGDFYGFPRLYTAAQGGLDAIFASVDCFRRNAPQLDDCTAVEIRKK